MTKVLKYEGCNFFRQRLVLATLSSRPVQISEIRADANEPGLKGKNKASSTFNNTLFSAYRVRGGLHSSS